MEKECNYRQENRNLGGVREGSFSFLIHLQGLRVSFLRQELRQDKCFSSFKAGRINFYIKKKNESIHLLGKIGPVLFSSHFPWARTQEGPQGCRVIHPRFRLE